MTSSEYITTSNEADKSRDLPPAADTLAIVAVFVVLRDAVVIAVQTVLSGGTCCNWIHSSSWFIMYKLCWNSVVTCMFYTMKVASQSNTCLLYIYICLACRSRQASIVLERYFRFEISLRSILCMQNARMEMGTR